MSAVQILMTDVTVLVSPLLKSVAAGGIKVQPLGQHAFNHLTHAADNPQHTNAALTLVGEMNRVYQPELKRYEKSIEEFLNGQSLIPTEGNYLDTTMPTKHLGTNATQQVRQREAENNLRVFGTPDKGRFVEPNSASSENDSRYQ